MKIASFKKINNKKGYFALRAGRAVRARIPWALGICGNHQHYLKSVMKNTLFIFSLALCLAGCASSPTNHWMKVSVIDSENGDCALIQRIETFAPFSEGQPPKSEEEIKAKMQSEGTLILAIDELKKKVVEVSGNTALMQKYEATSAGVTVKGQALMC